MTRATAIIANLWMGGAEYPFPEVRRAVVKEYRRVQKTIRRPLPASWDPRVEGKELPPRSRRAALKGLGAGHSVSPEVEQLPWEMVQRIAPSVLLGANMTPDTLRALLQALGLPEPMLAARTGNEALAADFDLGRSMMTGLVADPEESEITAETALAEADEETFRNVRDYARVAPWFYAVTRAAVSLMSVSGAAVGPTLGVVLRSGTALLCDPAHRLIHFVLMVHRAQLKGDHARGLGGFARFVLRPAKQLMLFLASDHEAHAMIRHALVDLGVDANTPITAVFSSLAARGNDPALRRWAWKMVRAAWRHGLADLWKLRKMRPPA